MRLVVGMLAVVLGSSIAAAEDGAPTQVEAKDEATSPAPARQRVPIRVVRIMPETNQALLYDRSGGGTHLLVTVGEKVEGYTVEAIDEDEVTLAANGQQIVLTAPDRPWRRHGGESRSAERSMAERPRAARGGEPAPADPYGGPADPYATPGGGASSGGAPSNNSGGVPGGGVPSGGVPNGVPSGGVPSGSVPSGSVPGPADPYAAEVREVKAPSWLDPTLPMPTARPVTTTALPPVPAPSSTMTAPAPAPAAPGSASPALVPTTTSAPAPAAAAPAPVATAAAAPAPVATAPAPAAAAPAAAALAPAAAAVLSRREVDAALADFGALSVAFRASFTPAGVQIDAVLDGSLFAKAGLRAGDVIASVDGKPLRSLDDVAALYARAGALRAVTAQVVRGGKPLTLRAVIQ
jgi:hypothetical protein